MNELWLHIPVYNQKINVYVYGDINHMAFQGPDRPAWKHNHNFTFKLTHFWVRVDPTTSRPQQEEKNNLIDWSSCVYWINLMYICNILSCLWGRPPNWEGRLSWAVSFRAYAQHSTIRGWTCLALSESCSKTIILRCSLLFHHVNTM